LSKSEIDRDFLPRLIVFETGARSLRGAKRRSNPFFLCTGYGLLRFARNDVFTLQFGCLKIESGICIFLTAPPEERWFARPSEDITGISMNR
jgi:hypothetical protein